jgi:dipeptidyl aminopeptidase/acylaminoacyl peptidase
MDLQNRESHVLGTSLDRYTSLASSSDGRRIVATRANPKATLWRMAIGDTPVAPSASAAVSMPAGKGFSSRLGPGYVLYVAEKEGGEAIWKLTDGAPVELWSGVGAHVFGGPEISPDGKRIAFSVEQRGKTVLYVMNSDGTNARVVSDALTLRGSPAWAPGGDVIASGADQNGSPHLLRIGLDGKAVSMAAEFAVDPVWSPSGDFIVYSAADIGTEFPVKAIGSSGQSHPIPALKLTRGARRLRFLHGGRALVALRGDIRHKDVWLIDLTTGEERQLTQLPADFNIRDFDVSADGRELLVERVQEFSDVVLIERPLRH